MPTRTFVAMPAALSCSAPGWFFVTIDSLSGESDHAIVRAIELGNHPKVTTLVT